MSDYDSLVHWDGILEQIRHIVAVVTIKELAYALGCSAGYLCDALKGTERKGIKASWLPTILLFAPPVQRAALLDAIARPVGFIAVPEQKLTTEQRLERLQRRVAQQFGLAGAALIAEES